MFKSKAFFSVFDIYKLTSGIVQHFDITPATVAMALAVAVAMAVVSAVIPALRGVARPIAAGLREVT